MTENLDLSLPRRDRQAEGKTPALLLFFNIVILVAVIINLAILLWPPNREQAAGKGCSLPVGAQKKLALKLEKQGLNEASISAWREYLATASIDTEERAMIWYRIGKLHQKQGGYEKALADYYRSESIASPEEISTEISRRVQDCLESIGKFSALHYELSDRVGIPSAGREEKPDSEGNEIVAEIGPEKITKSDLDGWIEQQIETQLSQMAPYISPDELMAQKEPLLKRFSGSSQRLMILNQLVLEEMLFRKASDEKLLDDPKVRREIKRQEHALLAKKIIDKELTEKINITEGDLKNYFEAHKEEYMTKGDEETEPRPKTFEEAKNEIFQNFRSKKEREVQENLFTELKKKYDVVMHPSAFMQNEGEREKTPDSGLQPDTKPAAKK